MGKKKTCFSLEDIIKGYKAKAKLFFLPKKKIILELVDSKELFYGRDTIPRLKWTFDKDGMLKSFDNINNDGIDIKEVENTVTIGEERTGSSRSQLIDNTIIIKNILNLFKAEKYTIDDIESVITNFSIHCSENDKVYDFNVIYYPHKKIICDYADKSKVLAKDVEIKDYYKEVNKLCEDFLKTKGVSFYEIAFKTTDFQTYIDTLNERMSYKEVLEMIEEKYEIVSKEKISEKTQITNFSQIKKDKDMKKKFTNKDCDKILSQLKKDLKKIGIKLPNSITVELSVDMEYFKLKLQYGERNQEYIWLNEDSANSDLYDIDSAIGSFTDTLYSIDEEVPLEEYIQTISTALGLGFSYNKYVDYKKNYENAKKYIDECNKEFSIFDFDDDDTLTYYF